MSKTTTPSYPSPQGLENRANSALLRIEMIQSKRYLPAGVRLALIAQAMEDEPVLTDPSTAAITARTAAVELSRQPGNAWMI